MTITTTLAKAEKVVQMNQHYPDSAHFQMKISRKQETVMEDRKKIQLADGSYLLSNKEETYFEVFTEEQQ